MSGLSDAGVHPVAQSGLMVRYGHETICRSWVGVGIFSGDDCYSGADDGGRLGQSDVLPRPKGESHAEGNGRVFQAERDGVSVRGNKGEAKNG